MKAALVLTLALGASVTGAVSASSGPAPPAFGGEEGETVGEGHTTLTWTLPGDADGETDTTFELQQSLDPGFTDPHLRHRGPENALFVSGLSQGGTYFRVRAVRNGVPGPWSETRAVEVDYPARGQVLALVAIGCFVFLATVAAILVGWARHRSPAAPRSGA